MRSLLGVVMCVTMGLATVRQLNQFPPRFHFSAATASYQVEGAWNKSGKSESIWDRMTHEHPEWIDDRSSGDVAANSYDFYSKDIQAAKEMGLGFYRFSLSWGRILPNGDSSYINQDGIDYYNRIINELLSNDIEPMVTIYHWDLPQRLQDLGGWPNPLMVDLFVEYARVAFKNFGDRVKWWITFNEPNHVSAGYADGHQFAPGFEIHGVADYLSTHTILMAHAKAYHLYHTYFRRIQHGQVGITLYSLWYEPMTNSSDDIEAAYRGLEFELGWFSHPIFSVEGNYPRVMRERVYRNSMNENRTHSRLPVFSKEWIHLIRGSYDFFGLNHYTTALTTSGELGEDPSRARDSGSMVRQDNSWPQAASPWLRVVPWGLRRMLNYIRDAYGNPRVFVTENGYSDTGELNDIGRVDYYAGYMTELLRAINEDNCNVIGYTAWSLIDNFEWTNGYKVKFGLYHVDYNSPELTRTPKSSAMLFKDIIRNRSLSEEYFQRKPTGRPMTQDLDSITSPVPIQFFAPYLHRV